MSERWQTQMLKGLAEMSVLAVLANREAYGYEILRMLERYPGLSMKESSLYLLLTRLKGHGLLIDRRVASDTGPTRRYFCLSAAGKERLRRMRIHWNSLSVDLNDLLAKGDAR